VEAKLEWSGEHGKRGGLLSVMRDGGGEGVAEVFLPRLMSGRAGFREKQSSRQKKRSPHNGAAKTKGEKKTTTKRKTCKKKVVKRGENETCIGI